MKEAGHFQRVWNTTKYYHGLFRQATIKDKIKDYEIDLEDPSDHIEEHIGEIDWENGYEEGEQKIKG